MNAATCGGRCGSLLEAVFGRWTLLAMLGGVAATGLFAYSYARWGSWVWCRVTERSWRGWVDLTVLLVAGFVVTLGVAALAVLAGAIAGGPR